MTTAEERETRSDIPPVEVPEEIRRRAAQNGLNVNGRAPGGEADSGQILTPPGPGGDVHGGTPITPPNEPQPPSPPVGT